MTRSWRDGKSHRNGALPGASSECLLRCGGLSKFSPCFDFDFDTLSIWRLIMAACRDAQHPLSISIRKSHDSETLQLGRWHRTLDHPLGAVLPRRHDGPAQWSDDMSLAAASACSFALSTTLLPATVVSIALGWFSILPDSTLDQSLKHSSACRNLSRYQERENDTINQGTSYAACFNPIPDHPV